MATINNNQVTIHKCIFSQQARKVKEAICDISQKESLSVGDTQAIRKLTEVYDVLSNPVEKNRDLYREVENKNHLEVAQ